METKTLFRILLIILGFYALGFQFVNFIFGTTVCKCSNDYILFFCYKIESIFVINKTYKICTNLYVFSFIAITPLFFSGKFQVTSSKFQVASDKLRMKLLGSF